METKYIVKFTSQFKKDYKKTQKRGKNMDELKTVIGKLANGIELDEHHHDHELTGNWKGHRECHIQPDWLLIYRLDDDVLILTLTRTGSHSDLF